MMSAGKTSVSLFVEKKCQQWVVCDPDGNFWMVPAVQEAWDHRQPYVQTDETELEPVPRHYKYLLDLPF
jgi:hypothetical protein